jgi:indole-3-glycerol phosphate synthase
VVQARAAGADAVLLIAEILGPRELPDLLRYVHELGMQALVELYDPANLPRVLDSGAGLIGVNNRDLRTFEVDLQSSISLLAGLPAESVKVAESGIRDGLDVALLRESGFDAFLIGEALLLAADPAAKLRELLIGPEI